MGRSSNPRPNPFRGWRPAGGRGFRRLRLGAPGGRSRSRWRWASSPTATDRGPVRAAARAWPRTDRAQRLGPDLHGPARGAAFGGGRSGWARPWAGRPRRGGLDLGLDGALLIGCRPSCLVSGIGPPDVGPGRSSGSSPADRSGDFRRTLARLFCLAAASSSSTGCRWWPPGASSGGRADTRTLMAATSWPTGGWACRSATPWPSGGAGVVGLWVGLSVGLITAGPVKFLCLWAVHQARDLAGPRRVFGGEPALQQVETV